MAYEYPYTKVTVQDDVNFVVAAHHNLQENQLFELTEAVKALDDHKDTFPALSGEGGKLVAVNGTEDGYEYVDAPSGGGLSEPGLICYIDPDFMFEGGGPGFSVGLPIAFITTRALTVDEVVILLVATDAPQDGITGTVVGGSSLPPPSTWYQTDVWFDVGLGTILVPYNYQDLTCRIGVYDNAASGWVDLHSIHVQASGGGPT